MSTPAFEVWVLGAALAADLVFGEPPRGVHPVVWIGRLQRALRARAPKAPAAALAYGAAMAIAGPALAAGCAWVALRHTQRWPPVQFVLSVFLLKSSFAVRGLWQAARQVYAALRADDLAAARAHLRSLVSRETSTLSVPLLSAAAVESVAENASDSIVAPLFYFALAGVPGAIAYRAANTLDSLIGYRGETEWLGKAAARLDDLLNLVPARITAALVAGGCLVRRASLLGALRVWWRDGSATESPNAGRPMAAMAGGLGVVLIKVGHYELGGGGREPGPEDIRDAIAVMAIASGMWAILVAAFLQLRGGHAFG